nr:hypothetical protein [Kibdelosporangium sp. MJ126-NF4]CTQ95442.1 hypothetical protein [Kibdelosporangium sp. MJ126-NF4]
MCLGYLRHTAFGLVRPPSPVSSTVIDESVTATRKWDELYAPPTIEAGNK